MYEWDVTYFQVVENRRPPEGARYQKPISPMFATAEQGQTFLERIRPAHPEARLYRGCIHFAPESEEDMDSMADVLDAIVTEGFLHE